MVMDQGIMLYTNAHVCSVEPDAFLHWTFLAAMPHSPAMRSVLPPLPNLVKDLYKSSCCECLVACMGLSKLDSPSAGQVFDWLTFNIQRLVPLFNSCSILWNSPEPWPFQIRLSTGRASGAPCSAAGACQGPQLCFGWSGWLGPKETRGRWPLAAKGQNFEIGALRL